MGVIAKDENQITLYYHSETSLGKQAHAYIESSEKNVLAVDISKNDLTGTQWAEIADNLGMNVNDLIDTDHPDFVASYGKEKANLDQHDWLKVLKHSPQVLAAPVAIVGNKFLQIKNPSDFVKFIEDDSAGLNERKKDIGE